MNKLIAVVGMCGSGKSIATDILEKNGWVKIYFGGVTYRKMAEEGIERTPDSERIFRENLRKKYGPECYAKLLLPEIKESLKNNNVVLDGLYSWPEYKFLRDEFGEKLKLICVVTDKNIRYDRIGKRIERPFTKEKAIERDLSEIENLSKGSPIAYADYFIFNNGTIAEYENRLNEIIENC
jgi:dephospho-CoA kinase